jgi:major membrane immunogen (membrane-anchored lipoprotein)
MRLVLLLICLAACSQSRGATAERQYEMASKSGAEKGDLCRLSIAVRDGYLADNNEAKYKGWKLTSDIDCLRAR